MLRGREGANREMGVLGIKEEKHGRGLSQVGEARQGVRATELLMKSRVGSGDLGARACTRVL